MVYTKALVAPSVCLFHLADEPDQWYVREVDESGNIVGNKKVQVGFSDGEYTCITGIPEGTLLDSGYGKFLGG